MKILFFAIFFLAFDASAKKIADIKIPDIHNCEGQDLPLQGSALRTATFLKIKVYVIGLYAKAPVTALTAEEVNLRPQCYVINYLRDFSNEDVDKAWEFQFSESSEFPYPELKSHVSMLKEFFGEIKGDRQHIFALNAKSTRLFENGVLKGEIISSEFQKNFISIWFGKKPPTEEVKKGLSSGP